MIAIAMAAARTGPGQRTIVVPILRQLRIRMARLGSNNPKRLPIVMRAGPRVSDTSTPTSRPTEQGTPRVWKYGMRVKLRQYMAPAMVIPDPRMTCAVPWNIS
ncbi:Uncharacterised protein [Mycobacteroides abscessus subsp. abscessus]|nr:Uncharacterised protein [Mycobacteroides abscessus subsp. abscessus]SIL63859.1 Uncharacterised protein [Mycobacteroides abscessus subsp. abscessus]SKT96106.1 Uncharacterised protein [Mycobacteroides abscessus subsp. abscessus]SKV04274.1 Uncharacterised protein [Mycobacteroides abscessus subsp. abscessus]